MPTDESSLIDIVNAGNRILDYVAGLDRGTVEANAMIRAAVLYEFLVMGEAVKRLSPGFRSSRPDVPWNQVAGMRDVLIHGYDRVEFDRVWSTIEHALPNLLTALVPTLPAEPNTSPFQDQEGSYSGDGPDGNSVDSNRSGDPS
jgi:uncharacterized protein with HEPN domain